jgi:small GTP-binding protein
MHRHDSASSARKVVLLGNSGVGKTSLAHRFIEDSFDSSVTPTIGPRNLSLSFDIDGREVNIALWDTAGQEQFRSIVPLYVRGARSAIVVASVDLVESFEAIPGWLELLNSAQEEPVQAVLAVNKIDLIDPLSPEISRLVETQKRGFSSCFFVSAATGDNVKHLFMEVARLAARARSGTDIEDTGNGDTESPPVQAALPSNSCC